MKLAPENARAKLPYANLSIVVGGTLDKNKIQRNVVLVDILRNAKSGSFALSTQAKRAHMIEG